MRFLSKSRGILLFTLLVVAAQASSPQQPGTRYPNEIQGYKFYQEARWKSLIPLVSTMADVRRVLGTPRQAHDVSRYTEPYPGDAAAKSPVFTYELDDEWQLLVYFVKFCFYEGPRVPASLGDRFCSIDLIPKKSRSFRGVEFPPAFTRKHTTAIDAAWDEFADGTGLVYEVYTTRTRFGKTQPGDLNRIKYGPSNDDLAKYSSK